MSAYQKRQAQYLAALRAIGLTPVSIDHETAKAKRRLRLEAIEPVPVDTYVNRYLLNRRTPR